MFRVRNVLLQLLSLTILANLSCVSFDAPTTPTPQPSRVDLRPCRFPNHKSELLCGKYPVFEDRAAKTGRTIPLNIVVVPSTTAAPKPDPVFFLTGGPGQGAARVARAREDQLMRDLRRERDLVFIDLRGTGDSNTLQCDVARDHPLLQSYFPEMFQPETIRACRQALEAKAELKHYTTTIAPQAKIPLHFAKGAQQAMDKLLDDCAADEGCRTAFPTLKDEFAAVLAVFDKKPVTFEFPHPATKIVQPVSLSRAVFVERLRLLLYDHSTARLIPLLIHQAASGDWTAFAKIALVARPVDSGIALGMYLSVTCSESIPLIAEDEVVRETQGTFPGDYRTKRHQQACSVWPRGEVSPEYYRPVKSEVPVLMLSGEIGEIDPATPPEYGKAASQFLSTSRQILLRSTPHNYQSDCATRLTVEFITKGSAKDLDTTCADYIRRPRFFTELPERYNR